MLYNFQLLKFNLCSWQTGRTKAHNYLPHSPFTIILFLLKNKPYAFLNWDTMHCTTITQKYTVTIQILLYHSPKPQNAQFCFNMFLFYFKNNNYSHFKNVNIFTFYSFRKKSTVVTIIRNTYFLYCAIIMTAMFSTADTRHKNSTPDKEIINHLLWGSHLTGAMVDNMTSIITNKIQITTIIIVMQMRK